MRVVIVRKANVQYGVRCAKRKFLGNGLIVLEAGRRELHDGLAMWGSEKTEGTRSMFRDPTRNLRRATSTPYRPAMNGTLEQ
jgi:hypothetical protein